MAIGARALVTGVTGFAGSHLAEHLRASGDEVAGIVRDAAEAGGAAGMPLFAADIADPAALERALREARPERVYHLAGFASPRRSFEDPLECHRVNVLGTAALFEAIRRAGGAPPRVLVVSSGEVYGRVGDAPVAEDRPPRPISPYGASKAAAEMIAIAAFAGASVPVVIARAFNHLGARQSDDFAAPAFARQIALAEAGRGPREIAVGNLEPVRDLSDVRDVVRAYRLLLERGSAGEVYNVASGRGISIRELLDRLLGCARVPLRVVQDPARTRPADVPCFIGDTGKLARATGWRPERAIGETVASVLDDWRARLASG